MLYKEPGKHHSLGSWLRLAGVNARNSRRRRVDTDLRELSPYLLRDLGLMDSGYPR